MKTYAITQLLSVDSVEKIQALNTLGVYTIRDMAEYAACRHAAFVMACVKQGNVENAGLENYIEASALTEDNLSKLNELDIVYLISVSAADAAQLGSAFGVETLSRLAELPPYVEAQQLILESIRGAYYEKPSAPPALIPRLIGNTHTQARYSNYVKEKEYLFDDYELTHLGDSDEPKPAVELIEIFYRSRLKFYLGYLASIHQKWINEGTHLGEIIHSLALAPGESRNFAVLDWYHRQRSSRREATTVAEELQAEFAQTRALNEVVQTTANEHLYGSTDVDATTKTTGAGLVGGLGGGKAQQESSGASTVLESIAGVIGGSLVGGGMAQQESSAASSVLQSMAGAIGGSLVHANGSVQGTLKSETTGERTVMGEVVQNISDATVQNASNVRSVMSTVVVEDEQAGRQRAQTRNVTNYNHSHALTVQYYEVLHSYRIDTGVDSLWPVLFLPFGPIQFNIELIKNYWYLFGKAVRQVLPRRFFEFDQVVKDFNPENEAFDASGDLRIARVKITRTRTTPEAIRVKLTDSHPEVTLAISGYDLDGCLSFKMTGSSTYVSYGILKQVVLDLSSFGAVDSFEIDEGIKASLSSDFTAELKRTLKQYLGDEEKTPKRRTDFNRADNELSWKSNREALKEDVDNNLFSIVNTNATIDLTIDIEYTVEDKNGQTQIVLQTIRKTYTYGQLKGEIHEEIADVTAHINTQLATVSDINPADVIAEIEQHFDFFKYGYTKYLLANAEKEQIIDIIEHLGIYGRTETLALSALIDPNPVGLTENLLIFKLKEDAAGLKKQWAQNFTGAMVAPLFGKQTSVNGHGLRHSVIRNGRSVNKYRYWAQPLATEPTNSLAAANATLYIDAKPDKAGAYAVEGTIDLINSIGNKQYTHPVTIHGTADKPEGKALKIAYQASGAVSSGQQGTLDWTLDFPKPGGEDVSAHIADFVRGLRDYESTLRQRHLWNTVFLPSSGVFAEAILGLSNASEYINVRRFFNWQDSPIPNLAPAVQAVNVNQDYAQPVPGSLTPTTPVSVLNQIAPQQYPMPTSLNSALQAIQNGSMFTDMSKTSQFTTILGSLAELANNTAQLSGHLAGDAAANALNAAVALGQQVASMVGAAMNTSVADPPKTLTAIGSAWEQLENVAQNSDGGAIPATDQAGMSGQGTPPPTGGGPIGNGTSTPIPAPVPAPTPEPPPPVYDTSDSIAGTLNIRTALPEPYDYATLNLLEMMDAFIPDAVDQTLYDIYKTLKDLVIWMGDDEEKKNQAVNILLAVKKGAKTSGWGIVIGLIIDLLTSQTFIELGEDVVVLFYDILYYFSHPYLGFAGAHDLGVWLSADIPYSKGKGKSAQVGSVASAPFNDVKYYVGGTPINTAPNPPTWGVEQLSGSMYIYRTLTDPSKLTVGFTDDVNGNSVTLNVDADQEMMFDTVSIVQAVRDDLKAKLTAILANWGATTQAEIEQAVADWIASLDSSSLDSWLGSLGLPTVAIDAIKAVLAAGGDLWGSIATFGVDVTTCVADMLLSVFDYITGIKDLVSGPTKINYHLHLAATIAYNATYPEGWKLSVVGETSKFPELTISNVDAAGAAVEVYSKNDVYPQGLLGLLLEDEEIPKISKYL